MISSLGKPNSLIAPKLTSRQTRSSSAIRMGADEPYMIVQKDSSSCLGPFSTSQRAASGRAAGGITDCPLSPALIPAQRREHGVGLVLLTRGRYCCAHYLESIRQLQHGHRTRYIVIQPTSQRRAYDVS